MEGVGSIFKVILGEEWYEKRRGCRIKFWRIIYLRGWRSRRVWKEVRKGILRDY